MKKNYSIFNILKNSLSNNENWKKMWRSPEPKKSYDIIIIGGGGHGLGTAYYLAKEQIICGTKVFIYMIMPLRFGRIYLMN